MKEQALRPWPEKGTVSGDSHSWGMRVWVTPLCACPDVIAEGEWDFDGEGGRRRVPVVTLSKFTVAGVVGCATNITLLSLPSGRDARWGIIEELFPQHVGKWICMAQGVDLAAMGVSCSALPSRRTCGEECTQLMAPVTVSSGSTAVCKLDMLPLRASSQREVSRGTRAWSFLSRALSFVDNLP